MFSHRVPRLFAVLILLAGLASGTLIKAQPKSGTPEAAAYSRGIAELRKGNADAAAAHFKQVLALAPQMTDALMGLAEARRASGAKASDVIADEYTRILSVKRDYWQAWEAAGCACLDDKNWSCNKYFSEVIRIRPEYARGHTGYARGYMYGMPSSNKDELIGKYALPALRKAVALDPKSGEAWYEMGNAYRMLKRPDSALHAYGNAIASQSGLALPYALRAELLMAQRNFSEAYTDFTKATLTDPTLVRAWTGRGMANTALNDYPAALADFNRALELKPADFNALLGRGMVHRFETRYPEAVADLTAADAAAVRDEHSMALKERSIAQRLSGNEAAAFDDIEKACLRMSKTDTGYAEIAYLYGQAYELRGKWSPARDLYAKSLAARESAIVRAAFDRAVSNDDATRAASRTTSAPPGNTYSSYSGSRYRAPAARQRKWVTERCAACDGSGKIYYEKLAVGGGLSSGGSTYYSTVNQYGTKTYGSYAGTGSVTCTRCQGRGTVSFWEYEDDDY